MLTPSPLGGRGRPLGVETEEHGVAIGEKGLDRLLGPERYVFALIVLDDQVEPGGAVVEPQSQLGFRECSRRRKPRLNLGNLLREILRARGIPRREPQAGNLSG